MRDSGRPIPSYHFSGSIACAVQVVLSLAIGERSMSMRNGVGAGQRGRRWLYILLIVPFIATLWVPFYNFDKPELGGIPFFYWYMFLWVIITSILTALVYLVAG
jgi:hypothetical protein